MTRDRRMVTIDKKIAEYRQQHPRATVVKEPPCETCGGSGYHGYGPPDWIKEYCDCPRGQRLKREQEEFEARVRGEVQQARQHLCDIQFSAAGIQERNTGLTVDGLSGETLTGKEAAVYAVQHLRDGQPIPTDAGEFGWAVFHGPVGTGKSAMLSEIAASWIERGRAVVVIQWNWMIASIQATYGQDGDSWVSMLEDIVRADIVLVDDLGDPDSRDRRGNVQPLSPDQRSKLYMIVDRRYGTGKPVVMATNLPRTDFRWLVGTRIYSRLEEAALFVPVNGANLREVKPC